MNTKCTLNENDFKEILDIDLKYKNLKKKIPYAVPTAKNAVEQKKIFFEKINENKEYNPQFKFTHKKISEKYKEKLNELNEAITLTGQNKELKKLYKERINELTIIIDMINNWGEPQSTLNSIAINGKPNFYQVFNAKLRCKQKVSTQKEKAVSVKTIGQELKKEVKRLTNQNLKVKYENLTNKVMINAGQSCITLNPNMTYTQKDLKRFKVHEIGTHYMRSYHGKKSGLHLLETGTTNYTHDEEGLAVCMEKIHGVSTDMQMKRYAGRVIAVHYALKNSFYKTYLILRKYGFSKEDSFTITHRAKRNLKDTSQNGAYLKDHIYFDSYKKIMKYINKYGLNYMFAGKVKCEELALVHKTFPNLTE